MEFDEISVVCPWLEIAQDLGQDLDDSQSAAKAPPRGVCLSDESESY